MPIKLEETGEIKMLLLQLADENDAFYSTFCLLQIIDNILITITDSNCYKYFGGKLLSVDLLRYISLVCILEVLSLVLKFWIHLNQVSFAQRK